MNCTQTEAKKALLRRILGLTCLCVAIQATGSAAVSESALQALKTSNSFLFDSVVQDWEIQDAVAQAGYKTAVKSILNDYTDIPQAVADEVQRLDGEGASDTQYKDVYLQACAARRKERMAPYLTQMDEIYFAKHTIDSRKKLTGRRKFDGKGIFLLRVDENTACSEEILVEGLAFDPTPSFEGDRLLFCKDGRNIRELNLQSKEIRDITPYDNDKMDIFPTYLPNGNILFASTRVVQVVPCNGGDVFNFYVCDKDGNLFRRISFDQADVYQPSLLPDGRVVFMRWGYNDRTRWHTFDLFTMYPDGTKLLGYYGNASCRPALLAFPRAIPNTKKVLVVLSSKSGDHMEGPMAILDVTKGDEEMDGLEFVGGGSPEDDEQHLKCTPLYQPKDIPLTYNSPFPLDENAYLVGGKHDYEEKGICGLYFVMRDGQRELLAYDQEVSCTQPAIVIEKPAVLPSSVDYSKNTAECYVSDIYFGRGMEGVSRGTVKKMRVVALDYRPTSAGLTARTGTGGTTFEPPASLVGASWDVKQVLGETPVHEDGSVACLVPANTPIYFQAIDENGMVVQSMREWTTFMPGETGSCTGCHESKYVTTPPMTPSAKGPKPLDEFYGPARGFSYDREVQPILDEHCTRCHNGETKNGKRMRDYRGNLISVAGRGWNVSYLELLNFSSKKDCYIVGNDCGNGSGIDKNPENPILSYYWYDEQAAPLPPYARGAAKSRLMDSLTTGHSDVSLSREEMDKIACWIDLAAPYHGDWLENVIDEGVRKDIEKAFAKRDRYWQEEKVILEQLGMSLSAGNSGESNYRVTRGSRVDKWPSVHLSGRSITVGGSANRDFQVSVVDCRGREIVGKRVPRGTRVNMRIPAVAARGILLIRMHDMTDFSEYSVRVVTTMVR